MSHILRQITCRDPPDDTDSDVDLLAASRGHNGHDQTRPPACHKGHGCLGDIDCTNSAEEPGAADPNHAG
jgi:hypothetical protein